MTLLALPRLPSYPWPHCGPASACTMGADESERCSCPCRGCRAARWGVSRTGIYRRRWLWLAPWGVTDWWGPRVFTGSNEWCDESVAFVLPPLGCLVLFWRPGPMRTVPCPEEWEMMNDEDRADYGPCGRYYGGRLNWNGHAHWEDGICDEAAEWLKTARPAR